MTVRFSARAEAELDLIYADSARLFGVVQADSYFAGLQRAFRRLSLNPRTAREREELASRARAYRYKVHMIVYREEDDGILVIRLPHARSDWINEVD